MLLLCYNRLHKGVDNMNIYIIILKDGKKFYVESFEDYQIIFKRYLKRYGNNLSCVLKEYCANSIEEIKRMKGGIRK